MIFHPELDKLICWVTGMVGWMPSSSCRGGCELSLDKNTLRRGVSISTPYPKCKIRRSPLALIPSMPSWRRGWGKRQKHYSRRSFCIRWGKLPQHRTVSSFLSYLYSPVGKFFELLCNCNIYVFVKLFTFSLEWVGSNYLTKKIILKSRDPNFFFFFWYEKTKPPHDLECSKRDYRNLQMSKLFFLYLSMFNLKLFVPCLSLIWYF